MRNKIIALLAGAVFSIVMVATAQAEGVKIHGLIGGSYGAIYSNVTGTGSTGGMVASSEHYVHFMAGGEKVSVKGSIRARQHNGGAVMNGTAIASTAKASLNKYASATWKPMPALSIEMGLTTGPAWANAMNGAYTISNPVNGDGEFYMTWSGATMADVTYAMGNMKFGLGLSGECRPSCGAISNPANPAVTLEATQTMAPHFEGKFGGIAVRFQMPSTTGTEPVSGDVHKGSGYKLGLGWSSGHMGAGIDLYDMKNTIDQSGGTPGIDKYSYTRTASHVYGNTLMVKGFGARLMMNYRAVAMTSPGASSLPDDPAGLYEIGVNSTSTMKLAYFIKANGGFVIPEYTKRAVKGTGLTEGTTTNSVMRLIALATF